MYCIADIDAVGLLSQPFNDDGMPVDESQRLWADRGLALNRYTGHEVLLTVGSGFGEGIFGNGVFGWS